METTINFSQVPFGYAICLNRGCVQAGTCLRQLIEPVVPADLQHWTIISPKYLASLEGNCPHYRPAVKVRFAKGFIGILQNLPYKQMQTIVDSLKSYFSRRTYFRIRKGERLLSPVEQRKILMIFKNCGVSQPGEFDAYIEEYDW
ncbi:MAG: DUF6078 family protein [Tannerellaceae bacterium]|nr:DUF6078 family protein [Tannerellaceae bacterium]